jgi:hypothetical protein
MTILERENFIRPEEIQKTQFQKERLRNFVNKFSFPRLAGTKAEEKAVNLAFETFKELGFEEKHVLMRKFEFTDFYSTTLIKLIMSMNLIFNLILILFVFIYVLLSIFFTIFMIIIVMLIVKGLKHPENPGFWGEYFGVNLEATNVITKIPASSISESEAGDIIISAHIDSKSQSYTTFFRVFLYKLWLYGGIAMAFFYILFLIVLFANIPFDFRFTLYGAWISVSIVSTSNLFLMFLNTHNKSPGALDNASGMAIVFELSNFFLKNPLNNFNIWFCQFSAEELGTMGSRIFVNDNENLFVKGRVFQINFDMISCKNHKKNEIEFFKSYGSLFRKINSPLLSKYFEISAKKENVSLKGFNLSTGAHTDTVPFHMRGWDAIDITTRAAAKYTHTKKDIPEKVDPSVLLDTCLITQGAIKMIDDDYKNLCESNEIFCGV